MRAAGSGREHFADFGVWPGWELLFLWESLRRARLPCRKPEERERHDALRRVTVYRGRHATHRSRLRARSRTAIGGRVQ